MPRSVRAGRQLDRHVDRRAGLPAQPGRLRPLDQQLRVRVLDAGRRGRLGVLVVRCVARAHVDDGRAAVAGGDPHVADGDVDRGSDRIGGVEGRHEGAPVRRVPGGGRCG